MKTEAGSTKLCMLEPPNGRKQKAKTKEIREWPHA
jgi:hypothetical protein